MQNQKKKPRTVFSEQFKLVLLQHYLAYAPDLTVRDVGEGRANIKRQLKAIIDKEVKMEDRTSLADYNLDNIAKIFAFNGLKAQGPKRGLLHIIDEVLEGQQLEHNMVKEAIPAIEQRARNIKFANRVYQPGDISMFYLCSI